MRAVAVVLVVLGGVLPIGAVVWGALVARARHLELLRRKQIALDNGGSMQAMIAAGLPATTWGDVPWMLVEAEIQRVRIVRESYGRPVVVGLVGVLCGTVGGVLSLYLPG